MVVLIVEWSYFLGDL